MVASWVEPGPRMDDEVSQQNTEFGNDNEPLVGELQTWRLRERLESFEARKLINL